MNFKFIQIKVQPPLACADGGLNFVFLFQNLENDAAVQSYNIILRYAIRR